MGFFDRWKEEGWGNKKMSTVKIQVLTKANYRTDVYVDGKFVYESFLHGKTEIVNLNKLIHALKLDNVEVVDSINNESPKTQ